jgi:DNA modification methylase
MYRLIQGNNIDILKQFPDNHFDSIVTDPPYGIDFLGKSWDANTGALETYEECLRVLKPGGHILAFSAPRTYHHLAITLEQAGFEIRDQIMWIYSSGFPKSQDVGRSIQRSLGVKETRKVKSTDGYNLKNQKGFTENNDVGYGEMKPITVPTDPEAQAWAGWGTALKPAHEPICMARKPIKTSIAKNCQTHGVGALNIDATRIPNQPEDLIRIAEARAKGYTNDSSYEFGVEGNRNSFQLGAPCAPSELGRFPSNVIGEIAEPYQKYFYCPKVSRRERHWGFEVLPPVYDRRQEGLDQAGIQGLQKLNGQKNTQGGNNHPTVKPIELMKYLIKLITPPNGLVLDPFNGSGSTGMAAVELGYDYVGIDLDANYIKISEQRIASWYKLTNRLQATGLFE